MSARTLINRFFPVILNITFWISIVSVFVFGFMIMSTPTFGGYMIWTGLFTIVAGVAGVVLCFGAIYTILDIRDILKARSENPR